MHVEPKHTMEELQKAAKAERNARVRDRIRGVILAKKGHFAKQVADDLGVSPRAVQDWVRWYNEGGIKNLADAPRPGQPRKCPADKFEAVKKRVLDGPTPEDKVCTLRGADVQKILQKEFGVVQNLSTTYNLLHRLGLEPLRPRPRHLKNDPQAMEDWQKSAPLLSTPSARSSRTKRSRSGLKTKPASVNKER